MAMERRNYGILLATAATTTTAITTITQQHPMSTLAESPCTTVKNGKNTTTTCVPRQLHHQVTAAVDHHHHPFIGNHLIPQDIYFNDIVRESLGTIRRQHAATAAAVMEVNDETDQESFSSSSSSSALRSSPSSSLNRSSSSKDYDGDDDSKQQQHSATTLTALNALERSGHRHAATLTLIGYKGGYGDDQINQDRAVVIAPFQFRRPTTTTSTTMEREEEEKNIQESCQLLGVFDGHGPLGELVAEYSVTELPRLLARKLNALLQSRKTNPSNRMMFASHNDNDHSTAAVDDDTAAVQQILIDSFIEIDTNAPADKSGGCTASVVLQLGNKLYIANAGDSRSFIVCYRKNTKVANIAYISREDKPHLPDERARLEKMGGFVELPTRHGGTSRVYYMNPKNGYVSGLAMSRSIGDRIAGKLGVIPDPIVHVMDVPHLVQATRNNELTTPSFAITTGSTVDQSSKVQQDEMDEDDVHIFAVSATDGLMDHLSKEAIAATLAHSLFEVDGPHLLTACEALIKAAAAGWHTAHQGRYRDDIAIAVSRIRIPPAPPLSETL